MNNYNCPGQDGRNIKVEILKCNNCGYRIEIFSDEIKVWCPGCKTLVCRLRLPTCVDWCKNEGIFTIADLTSRVITHEDYEILWYNRCKDMQNELITQRKK